MPVHSQERTKIIVCVWEVGDVLIDDRRTVENFSAERMETNFFKEDRGG